MQIFLRVRLSPILHSYSFGNSILENLGAQKASNISTLLHRKVPISVMKLEKYKWLSKGIQVKPWTWKENNLSGKLYSRENLKLFSRTIMFNDKEIKTRQIDLTNESNKSTEKTIFIYLYNHLNVVGIHKDYSFRMNETNSI